MIQSVTISRRVMTLDWPLFPVQPNGYLRTPLIVYVVNLIENGLQQQPEQDFLIYSLHLEATLLSIPQIR